MVDFLISSPARDLLNNEFKGNGCGSKGMNLFLVHILTNIFSFNLKEPCKIHDAEYSIPKHLKNEKRKSKADLNFKLNIEKVLTEYPEKLSPMRKKLYKNIGRYRQLVDWAIDRLPEYYHGAVVVHGDKSYWT